MFSLFRLIFNHDYIIGLYNDFARIAASNTAINDVQIRSHIEYLTQILLCSFYN